MSGSKFVFNNVSHLLILAAVVGVGSAGVVEAGVTYQTIALTGESGAVYGRGPSLGAGVNFSEFGIPVINASGTVAFAAVLSGTGVTTSNNSGTWTSNGGVPQLVARKGNSANIGDGINFSFIGQPVLNASGTVAFLAGLTGTGVTSTNDGGYWTATGGTLQLVAREGSSANIGAGVNFRTFAANPALSDSGTVAFSASLTGTGVNGSNDSGIWTSTGGTIALVAREGASANVGAGVNFSTFTSPVISANGSVAFLGTVNGSGVNSSNNTGIWSTTGGSLTAVARTGSPVNMGDGVSFSRINTSPVINASGDVAFEASFIGTGVNINNDTGIWKSADGKLTLVAQEGTSANAGDGVTFGNFPDPVVGSNPVINDSGTVAFTAFVRGAGDTSFFPRGLWTSNAGTQTLVASAGSSANLGDGVNFLGFNSPIINAAGNVAFLASLTGTGVDDSNNNSLWVNEGGVLTNIVREGSLFDVDPSDAQDMRMVASIIFRGNSGDENGRSMTFNDDGLLTFSLRFTDDSLGIFTAHVGTTTIPEPSSLALLVLPGLMLARRRG